MRPRLRIFSTGYVSELEHRVEALQVTRQALAQANADLATELVRHKDLLGDVAASKFKQGPPGQVVVSIDATTWTTIEHEFMPLVKREV